MYYGLGGETVSSIHEEIDKYIGKLLSCLSDREMLDNTLIVFPVIAVRLMKIIMFHFCILERKDFSGGVGCSGQSVGFDCVFR